MPRTNIFDVCNTKSRFPGPRRYLRPLASIILRRLNACQTRGIACREWYTLHACSPLLSTTMSSQFSLQGVPPPSMMIFCLTWPLSDSDPPGWHIAKTQAVCRSEIWTHCSTDYDNQEKTRCCLGLPFSLVSNLTAFLILKLTWS